MNSPLGPFFASNQFFTARSFAPVRATTVLMAACVPPYSRRSAKAIASANRFRGKMFPEMVRFIRSLFVNDIRDLPRVASAEREALLSGHAHACCASATGEHVDSARTEDSGTRDADSHQGRAVRSHVHRTSEVLDRQSE